MSKRDKTASGLGTLVDWREIGLDLRRWGISHADVAKALNVTHSTVQRWFNDGSEPGFSSGYFLLRLHGRLERKQHDRTKRQRNALRR